MRVRQVTVAATVGVQCPLALAVPLALIVTMSLRKQDLAHAHCEEAEGRRVLAVLCPTVMATVRITAVETQRGMEKMRLHKRRTKQRKKMYL